MKVAEDGKVHNQSADLGPIHHHGQGVAAWARGGHPNSLTLAAPHCCAKRTELGVPLVVPIIMKSVITLRAVLGAVTSMA
jgi:hypothetical protein